MALKRRMTVSQHTNTTEEHLLAESERLGESERRELKQSTLTFKPRVEESVASRWGVTAHTSGSLTLNQVQAPSRKNGTTSASSAGGGGGGGGAAAAATASTTVDGPPAGTSFKQFVDGYIVPREDMRFVHQFQLEGTPLDVQKLLHIFDVLVRKINFGSVHALPELETNDEWREILHALECVCMILFIQFNYEDMARIETYTRITVWIQSQITIRESFAIEKIDFVSGTTDCIKEHLDEFMLMEPDAQLLQAVHLSVYLRRMSGGMAYRFFQKNPLQTTQRNPISILNEESHEHELRYMNDYLLHAHPTDMYSQPTHPFHDDFVFMLFACNLKWNKQQYDWAGAYTISNFHLLQKLSIVKRSVEEDGHKRPLFVPLLGRQYIVSMWRKNLPSDTEAIEYPTLYVCSNAIHRIATWGWVLLYHYDGKIEDGYTLGQYFYDFYKFEPLHSILSKCTSFFADDSDDDDDESDDDGMIRPDDLNALRQRAAAHDTRFLSLDAHLHTNGTRRHKRKADDGSHQHDTPHPSTAIHDGDESHGDETGMIHALNRLQVHPNAVFDVDFDAQERRIREMNAAMRDMPYEDDEKGGD
jgi:hypothetical protein